jgi:exopolysaccharide biosynthesis polyprenyl glycosylphosphotransferase
VGQVASRPAAYPRHRAETFWVVAAAVLDMAVAAVIALIWLRFRPADYPTAVRGVPYTIVAALFGPVWVLALTVGGAYHNKFVGVGSQEFQRVFNAGIRLLALVAVGSFALKTDFARSFVVVVLPLTTAVTLVERHTLRKWVHRQRARGRFMRRVVVVGAMPEVVELVSHVQRAKYAGLRVVGVCVPGDGQVLTVGGVEVPVLGAPEAVAELLHTVVADTVAVVGSGNGEGGYLRRLAWRLEGRGVELVVAPAITDVAGPRILVRPLEGLPLLHIEEPQLSGADRLLKELLERVGAAFLLVALFPLCVLVGLAIRVTSRGPALFRQLRIGRHGQKFTIFKFRTMQLGAEEQLSSILDRNDQDGLMFKVRQDPRVTPIGLWLRRYSLDELPQLWNVLKGTMSLVGPRPPLPFEVEQYAEEVNRRLLVKPGMTGLWQVRGRADLSWEETVRLDLYYVENWSLALDAAILWKTIFAVLHRRGAY